jgi:broad specificity phosphatase PhoE
VLILLRHGRTENNARSLLQGRVDASLDEVGVAQAARAGEHIRATWSVDDVVTSTLRRTAETAAAAGLDRYPTHADPRWAEIDYGVHDQQGTGAAVGGLIERWAADVEYRPPGGESMGALYRRVVEACEDLVRAHPARTTVVVTHALPIKAATAWALGGTPLTMLRMRVSVCSITVLERSPSGLVLSSFNDVHHLRGL